MNTQQVMVMNEAHGRNWAAYEADAYHLGRQLPDNSVGFSLHSPPFSSLYTYSDSANDMGNCIDDAQFFAQYRFLLREMLRVMMPGRLVAVHCKPLVDYIGSSGRSGLRDFPGDIVRAYQDEGFKFHSRVCIWKCPVTEQQRTNAHGLLYKTLRADGSFSRQGLAEDLLIFRKWPRTPEEQAIADANPVRHWNPTPKRGDVAEPPAGDEMPLEVWQKWASPVWLDIDQTDVLNVAKAREDKDEKHMCPLQLDLIERCIVLWSNRGDVVWSPFMGIGSEGVKALERGRKFIGSELKSSYFKSAVKNLSGAEPEAKGQNLSIFDLLKSQVPPPAPPAKKRGGRKAVSVRAALTPTATTIGPYVVPPPGTFGPGDYGPDSFGGSDFPDGGPSLGSEVKP